MAEGEVRPKERKNKGAAKGKAKSMKKTCGSGPLLVHGSYESKLKSVLSL